MRRCGEHRGPEVHAQRHAGQAAPTTSYEAEEAQRSGSAGVNTDHTGGYSGSGTSRGQLQHPGRSHLVHRRRGQEGTYDVALLRYANGRSPFSSTRR
ncbi:hypothetical protein LV779_08485 [Streptomyces thinghirensis]|nr:hypothetical protein [Streptomyces thinghirensis]